MYLAGDFVRLAQPAALMERAATAGVTAANAILQRWGLAPEPVAAGRRRGLLPASAA